MVDFQTQYRRILNKTALSHPYISSPSTMCTGKGDSSKIDKTLKNSSLNETSILKNTLPQLGSDSFLPLVRIAYQSVLVFSTCKLGRKKFYLTLL